MIKICHIITTLGDGGAEKILYETISSTKSKFDHHVICLSKKNKYYSFLRKKKIPVYLVNENNNNFSFFSILFKTNKIIKNINPNLIQTWLPHSDLVGSLIGKFRGINKIIWNFRVGKINYKNFKFTTNLIFICQKLFSDYLALHIIYNSKNIKEYFRLNNKNSTYIPNGCKIDKFKHDRIARKKIRDSLGLDDKTILLSQISRFDILKNNIQFLYSFSNLKNKIKNKNLKCILVGIGNDKKNKYIQNVIKELNLKKEVILLGQTDNVEKILSATDINFLTSLTEGFPNIVIESLACSAMGIYPRTGDIPSIVNKDFTYRTGNYTQMENLAEKIINSQKLYKKKLILNRKRILNKYSHKVMIKKFDHLWSKI